MTSRRESAIERIAAVSTRERLIAACRGGEVTGSEGADKLAALLDAARVLRRVGVPFALIGGVAVGHHSGVPRATVDVDLAVRSNVDRSLLAQAFQREGFERRGEFAHSSNFRHRSGEPVQLAFDSEFDAMIERAEQLALADQTIPVVTRADLIAMKRRAAGDPARRRSKRLRDEADLALLEGDVPDPDEGW
jgi:hypothetical protein